MEKTRLDKWLWSVRFYKSRTLASEACKNGKISCKSIPLKAAHFVFVGDLLTIRKNGFQFLIEVRKIIDKRVGAALAVACYENKTSEEELNKYAAWFTGKAQAEKREKGTGRPTKRERREIDDFKTIVFDDFDND
ncbi:MAG: RNA-binding S4 domain-containing protein [Saprospiraceae bacterium]|nr:RNA-binding S4 domain-containing protein [Saprospiraceae bacterium]HRG68801.1 RNA-binding S4 domain-containing protein [Saprospiraceae bacterium]